MLVRTTARHAIRSPRQAFTLLEVLVVVAIIVMLAGVGSFYVYQQFEEAKVSRAKMDVKKLAGLVNTYRLKNDGEIPGNLQALTQPHGANSPLATPEEIIDPWNKPYQLSAIDDNVVVSTVSPKGVQINNTTSK